MMYPLGEELELRDPFLRLALCLQANVRYGGMDIRRKSSLSRLVCVVFICRLRKVRFSRVSQNLCLPEKRIE